MNYYVEFSQDIRVNCATDNSNYYHIQKKVDTRVLVIINKYKISFMIYTCSMNPWIQVLQHR